MKINEQDCEHPNNRIVIEPTATPGEKMATCRDCGKMSVIPVQYEENPVCGECDYSWPHFHMCHKCGKVRKQYGPVKQLPRCDCLGHTWFDYEEKPRTLFEAMEIMREARDKYVDLFRRQQRSEQEIHDLRAEYPEINPSRSIVRRPPMRVTRLPDNAQWTNRMAISGSTGKRYIVARMKGTKKWGCSCPGWVLKKPGKPRRCKHLTTMMPYLKQLASGKKTRPQLRGR